MYTGKQYKGAADRLPGHPDGKRTQQFRLRDNREKNRNPILIDDRPSAFQAKGSDGLHCVQPKLPDGLTPASTAKVWPFPNSKSSMPEGIVCKEIEVDDGDIKVNALKNICVKASEIGEKTQNERPKAERPKAERAKEVWATETDGSDKYNNLGSGKINPFQVPIKSACHSTRGASEIKLYYHFGPYNHGYIVRVESGGDKGNMVYKDMHSLIDTKDKYSNQHDTTDSSEIISQTNKTDNLPLKYDAYTKLAGEGARFQCVRENIHQIKNDTYFYAEGVKIIVTPFRYKKKDLGVSFKTLWGSWGRCFDKKFNISNDEVKAVIKRGVGLRVVLTEAKPDKIKL